MEKVRIQDDLYTYVNQEHLDKLEIPADKPSAGGFEIIARSVEETMMKEFNDMCEKNEYPTEFLRKACVIFKAAQNFEKKASKCVLDISQSSYCIVNLFNEAVIMLGERNKTSET